MSTPSIALSTSQVADSTDLAAEQQVRASLASEWQLLQTILVSENGRSILSELKQVAQFLRDTKSQTWQKRVNSIQHIKTIFLITLNYIEYDPDIVDEVVKGCPQIINQIDMGTQQPTSSGPSDLSSLQSHLQISWPNLSGQVPDQVMRKTISFHIISWMQRILQPLLVLQLSDTRTGVVKETCLIILWMKKEFPDEFALDYKPEKQALLPTHKQNLGGGSGVKYFDSEALPKLVSSGNKQIQEMGHSAMHQILEGGPLIDNLIYHLVPFVNSKNSLMRLRNAQYFEMLLRNAMDQGTKAQFREHIEQNSDILDYFLIRSSEDQSLDVRNQALFCVMLYRQLFPQKCSDLILHGITQTIVRTQIIQQLNMQKDLDDCFARSLREANLKQQCIEMQRLRSLFDNAFTPDQFRIVQTQKELNFDINKKQQPRKNSQNSNNKAADCLQDFQSKCHGARPSPRHAASPSTNLVPQKHKCCHLDKNKVYQLQKSGTLCPSHFNHHHSSSKSATSIGQESSKQASRPTSQISQKHSQAFVTPRRGKPAADTQNSEKKLSQIQLEDGYNTRSTPNLVRHKTLISQTGNTTSRKNLYTSKMETPKRKVAAPSNEKTTPVRKTPTLASNGSVTPQRKIPGLSASKTFGLQKSANATPTYRAGGGASKTMTQGSAIKKTPRKASPSSSVSATSYQKAKTISLAEAKAHNGNGTPQGTGVNAQRVQQIRTKYTLNDSRKSNAKPTNRQNGQPSTIRTNSKPSRNNSKARDGSRGVSGGRARSITKGSQTNGSNSIASNANRVVPSMNNSSIIKNGSSNLSKSQMSQINTTRKPVLTTANSNNKSQMMDPSKTNKLLIKSTDFHKCDAGSKMSSKMSSKVGGRPLDANSQRLNSSMTKNTARQTPQAAFQQSTLTARAQQSKMGGPSKASESPRSHDSSKLFDFPTQNIVTKTGSQGDGNKSHRSNVPKSQNNLGRVAKNEKKVLTSRPEQSGQFTTDFQKLNFIAIQSAKARHEKTMGSSSQSWSTRGLAKTKTLQSSHSSSIGKKGTKTEGQAPHTREQAVKHYENRKRFRVVGFENDKTAKMYKYFGNTQKNNNSSSMEKKVDSKLMKQSERSVNSRIGCGVLNDHGSTEVTTIESYDLTSAIELNLTSAMSREVEDSEGLRVAGDSLKKQGAQENKEIGLGDLQNQSQVFPNRDVDCKDSQMFELVQFFNIKDISQLVPKGEHKCEEQNQQVGQNDSFQSSDVSYARASDSPGGNGDQSVDDLKRALAETVTKEIVINDYARLGEEAPMGETLERASVNGDRADKTKPRGEDLSGETIKSIEECIRKGLPQQLESILRRLRKGSAPTDARGPRHITGQRFKRMIYQIDADIFTFDELREVFALHGESSILEYPSELLALIGHFLPEQAGFGVFRKVNLLCVGLLWSSGIGLLSCLAVGGKQIEVQCDAESENEGLIRPSGVVEEVDEDDDERSQESSDAAPPLDDRDVDETSRRYKDQIYSVAHDGRGSTGRKIRQDSMIQTEQSSQVVDDQALFWDILNEH